MFLVAGKSEMSMNATAGSAYILQNTNSNDVINYSAPPELRPAVFAAAQPLQTQPVAVAQAQPFTAPNTLNRTKSGASTPQLYRSLQNLTQTVAAPDDSSMLELRARQKSLPQVAIGSGHNSGASTPQMNRSMRNLSQFQLPDCNLTVDSFSAVASGAVILGRYVLSGPVQPGGHAVVRMAHDEKLGQPVAIKINTFHNEAAVEIEVMRTARSAVSFFFAFRLTNQIYRGSFLCWKPLNFPLYRLH
jgi:hypothetical protein